MGLLQCYLSEPLRYLISGHLLCRASDVFADREAGVGESCASSCKASDVKDQPGGRCSRQHSISRLRNPRLQTSAGMSSQHAVDHLFLGMVINAYPQECGLQQPNLESTISSQWGFVMDLGTLHWCWGPVGYSQYDLVWRGKSRSLQLSLVCLIDGEATIYAENLKKKSTETAMSWREY